MDSNWHVRRPVTRHADPASIHLYGKPCAVLTLPLTSTASSRSPRICSANLLDWMQTLSRTGTTGIVIIGARNGRMQRHVEQPRFWMARAVPEFWKRPGSQHFPLWKGSLAFFLSTTSCGITANRWWNVVLRVLWLVERSQHRSGRIHPGRRGTDCHRRDVKLPMRGSRGRRWTTLPAYGEKWRYPLRAWLQAGKGVAHRWLSERRDEARQRRLYMHMVGNQVPGELRVLSRGGEHYRPRLQRLTKTARRIRFWTFKAWSVGLISSLYAMCLPAARAARARSAGFYRFCRDCRSACLA